MIQSSSMKKTIPLIVGNWKLNPATVEEAAVLAKGIAQKRRNKPEPYVAIAPSFPHLSEVNKKIKNNPVALAAQNISTYTMGAHTGEVSVLQLKDLGVEFVIIGHSERRAMGETDELVREKLQLALKHRLTPIVCIGEKERDEQAEFFNFVERQIRSLCHNLTAAEIKKVIIAYEPIWAIGTGQTATAENVKEMQLFIETVLTKIYDRTIAGKVRLLYGGSVKPHNAAKLHTEGEMNGFLVGGASLKADSFIKIIEAVS